jgi:hypothetical protein
MRRGSRPRWAKAPASPMSQTAKIGDRDSIMAYSGTCELDGDSSPPSERSKGRPGTCTGGAPRGNAHSQRRAACSRENQPIPQFDPAKIAKLPKHSLRRTYYRKTRHGVLWIWQDFSGDFGNLPHSQFEGSLFGGSRWGGSEHPLDSLEECEPLLDLGGLALDALDIARFFRRFREPVPHSQFEGSLFGGSRCGGSAHGINPSIFAGWLGSRALARTTFEMKCPA